ncbi:MAG: hypothetical protein HQ513_06160 [Rhodospirillales bacterium]|nr:hypothetical protein [Rhodospirillales bacterium]
MPPKIPQTADVRAGSNVTATQRMLVALSWIWVIGAFVLYIHQFKSFLLPVLNLLGVL